MGIFSIHVTWPTTDINNFERIKRLAGHDNLSKLIRQLLRKWLDEQETILKQDPIGLRNSSVISDKIWIDSLCEIDTRKITEDIDLVEDQYILSKLKVASDVISKGTDARSIQLWRMERLARING